MYFLGIQMKLLNYFLPLISPFFGTFFYLLICISIPSRTNSLLVVEQADVLLHKGDAQLLGRVEHGLIVLAAARRGNVLDS